MKVGEGIGIALVGGGIAYLFLRPRSEGGATALSLPKVELPTINITSILPAITLPTINITSILPAITLPASPAIAVNMPALNVAPVINLPQAVQNAVAAVASKVTEPVTGQGGGLTAAQVAQAVQDALDKIAAGELAAKAKKAAEDLAAGELAAKAKKAAQDALDKLQADELKKAAQDALDQAQAAWGSFISPERMQELANLKAIFDLDQAQAAAQELLDDAKEKVSSYWDDMDEGLGPLKLNFPKIDEVTAQVQEVLTGTIDQVKEKAQQTVATVQEKMEVGGIVGFGLDVFKGIGFVGNALLGTPFLRGELWE